MIWKKNLNTSQKSELKPLLSFSEALGWSHLQMCAKDQPLPFQYWRDGQWNQGALLNLFFNNKYKAYSNIRIDQLFSPRAITPPLRRYLAMSGDIFNCHSSGISWVGAKMLLSTLQRTGRPPRQGIFPVHKVNSATVERPRHTLCYI